MKKNLIYILILLIGCNVVYAQQPAVKMPPMIYVEGGTFTMGNPGGNRDEQPAHQVTVTSFYFGKYEVTFQDFKKFIDATGYVTDAEKPDTVRLKHGLPPRGINNGTWMMNMNGVPVPQADTLKPVGNISWFDAVEYCNWLSKSTGKKFRLPTEAEWEYAAKGGTKSKGFKYVGGNNLDEVAWYLGNSDKRSHNIGQKMPNELEIYDMAGNIREWCSDWYGESYYKTSPKENPAGPDRGTHRILRGGSWGSEEGRMRISYRNNEFPYNSALGFGFRPAITDETAARKAEPKPAVDLMKDLDAKGFIDIYGINFDIGKATVKPESYPIVEQITAYLKEHPTTRIMIEGHTDNTGSDALNLSLSDKRALSIKAEIVKRGIDAGRMETKGFGSSKPVADNKTAAGRTQNRRVTIKKL
ncbi:MAG: SUMF1/EgtB/PvdO family nonheme iron enzyme [Bacteroidetes bacterium]|nr:SUMF1/EgtB/PvdO family nonheme iron enzyme [Bacteroidota bacterium]